ncbi:MAG: hypothetical protein WDW36_003873 [Sanguina aurantia]
MSHTTIYLLPNPSGGAKPTVSAAGSSKPVMRDMGLLSEVQITSAPDLKEVQQPQQQDPVVRAVEPLILSPRPVGGSVATNGGSSSGFFSSPAFAQVNLTWKITYRKVLRQLSSLPRAIALMGLVAGLSGIGTVVPQNKGYDFYIDNYPSGAKAVLGILDYQLLIDLQLDHIYTSWYFYLAIGLLAASLAACTTTRQLPAVKVAQRWRFLTDPASLLKMGTTEALPNAHLPDLGKLLRDKGYQVFCKDSSLYAFKGLSGRLGPIGVHASLLLILFGTAYSGFGGYHGSVMAPEGSDFVISDNIKPISSIATRPDGAGATMHVNKFDIEYRSDGSVSQFFSSLTVRDEDGVEHQTKRISVNDPFRYGGVTMYQTDWSLAAVTLQVLSADSPLAVTATTDAFNLPLANMEGKPGVAGRLWASFLPLGKPATEGAAPPGVSILTRDPQSVIFYDRQGKFVGIRRPGSGKSIEVEGVQIVVTGVVGSTGLEIKSDPGVPWVYAGFAGLMITTLVSYLSHSQVWALKQDGYMYVVGKTNRATLAFDAELSELLEEVPEGASPAL